MLHIQIYKNKIGSTLKKHGYGFGSNFFYVVNVYSAFLGIFNSQPKLCQSSSYKGDTELKVLCFVNIIQFMFFLNDENSSLGPKMNVGNARKFFLQQISR